MLIRTATVDELKKVVPDPLTPYSVHRYAAEKNGKVVAYFGVSSTSLVGREGWPWLCILDPLAVTPRVLVKHAKPALNLWLQYYDVLLACAEKNENQAWFRFLGFRVDKHQKPIYAKGKTMVYMRYQHGRADPDK
jgi:hypothetical protein